MSGFGVVAERLRTAAGLSVKLYCECLSVSRQTYYNWVKGAEPKIPVKQMIRPVMYAIKTAVTRGELPLTKRKEESHHEYKMRIFRAIKINMPS